MFKKLLPIGGSFFDSSNSIAHFPLYTRPERESNPLKSSLAKLAAMGSPAD
jgi:hypothetical protein